LHYLQDKETRDFIYEFIERHGGVDAALMEEDDASATQIIAPQPGKDQFVRRLTGHLS
jgi:hypothetical protein